MSDDAEVKTRLSGRVVSIGAHILDILGRPVSDIPPGQRSTIIDEIRITAAGTAAGVSVDLAKLGVAVKSVGAVGDDVMGDLVVTLMNRHGVDTSLLTVKHGERTSATILPIRPNGERPALHAPGASGNFGASDITAAHQQAFREATVLHVGGPDSMTGFDAARLAELVADAKSFGATTTMDTLRPGDGRELQRLAPLLAQIDWFLPNNDQVRSLTGLDDPADGARRLLDMGVGGVAITLGDQGCVVMTRDEERAFPALEVSVVDTTGCGDGFDAGFITGLLLEVSPFASAWLGLACGGLVATGLGSDAGIVNLDATVGELEQDGSPPEAKSAAAAIRSALRDAS
ncbi:MAG: sugar kinase [Acidimicrobiales bacterium]